jgi:hypothetical protein
VDPIQAATEVRLLGHGAGRDNHHDALVELDDRQDVRGRQAFDDELRRGDGLAQLLARHRAAPINHEAEVQRLPRHLGHGRRGESEENWQRRDLAEGDARPLGHDVEAHTGRLLSRKGNGR